MESDDFNKAAESNSKAEPCASDYLDMLDDAYDMTEEQKLEMLEALFNIMKSFVLMGYGAKPVGNLIAAFLKADEASPDLIKSKQPTPKNNNKEG